MQKRNLSRKDLLHCGEILSQREPTHVNSLDDPNDYMALIREGMAGVTDDTGTARNYFRNYKNVQDVIAAKTGTAQVTSIDLENNAWFVCFAPYDDPQIAITVMIPFGEGSGTPAPTVAKAIIREYLGLDYTPTNTTMQTVLAE